MTDPAKAEQLARAVRALPMAGELAQILDMEFEALQKQDLDRFEQLQGRKADLLAELAGRLDATARRKLGRSLSIREVDAGSCNGC